MKSLAEVALKSPSGLIATAGGVGLAPKAPGTFGGAVALVPAWFLVQQPLWFQVGVVLVALVIGVFACDAVDRQLGVHDHGAIVWDEVVGMWVTLLAAPADFGVFLTAFVLFRVFDIAKPPPIRWMDRHLPGGWGVMVDDVVAGIFAWIVLFAVAWLVGW